MVTIPKWANFIESISSISEIEILNFDCNFFLNEFVKDLLSFRDLLHLIENLIVTPETYNFFP